METPSFPSQYGFLLRLLRECSDAFTAQLSQICGQSGKALNLDTMRFEVDVYFVFLLSRSLRGLNHNRHVWEELCELCEVWLSAFHGEKIHSDDLPDVIVARIECYGETANHCAQSGEYPKIHWLKILRQHIMASSHSNRVEAEHPVMLGSALEEFQILISLVRINLQIAGAFTCALKHIFKRTSDIRMISAEELRRLAEAGFDEAEKIAANTAL